MSALFAMTLPALVVILIVAGAVDVLVTRRRRKGGTAAKPKVASAGFDVLGLALAPGTQHKLEHDLFLELDREEAGDAAPPRSTVDLDAGTARIVLPAPSSDDEPPSDDLPDS